MDKTLSEFEERLFSDWLPNFCNAPHRNYPSDGFKKESMEKLTSHDAHWFMKALEMELFTEFDGFFVAPKSSAKEQIFWQGQKNIKPRPITLWIEPIITIGALGRLHTFYSWPTDNLGAQSEDWAFDLVCYKDNSDEQLIACEVKKTKREVDKLLELMMWHSCRDETEPKNSTEKNAYRKVQGIRKAWPSLFWALGPDDYGKVFKVVRDTTTSNFELVEVDACYLHYSKFY